MSETYDLVCDRCKQRIWIGQGRYNSAEFRLYPDWQTKEFLFAHMNHPIRFINGQNFDCAEYQDVGAEDGDYKPQATAGMSVNGIG